MKPKKTETVSATITPETKEKLKKLAEEKHWTTSQLINLILEAYCKDEGRTIKL